MRLKNKLEIDSTLKVGALPTASTSNFSVLFENGGTVSKRAVGDIINKNSTDFIQGISNSFPSIFNYNTSTTPSDANLVVSFKNQLAGTVFAAPTTLNGTPSFRKLIDSDLSETSIFSQLGNYVTLDTEQDITGKKTFSNAITRFGSNIDSNAHITLNTSTTDAEFWIKGSNSDTTGGVNVFSAYVGGAFFGQRIGSRQPISFSSRTSDDRVYFNLSKPSNDAVVFLATSNSNDGTIIQAPQSNTRVAFGYFVSNALMTGRSFINRGAGYFSGVLDSNGFIKHGQTNDSVLLAGGGHRPVSDFALATDIPDVSGFVPNTRTITAGNGLSGGGNLTANRTIALGTPSPIGLSTTNSVTSTSHTHALDSDTISEINKGQQALTNIGTLNSLTTTDKSNLVNAINEVNGNIPNVTGFVPYTGADQPVNLNTQTLNTEGLVQIQGVLSKTQSSLEMSRLVGTTASNHLRKYTDVASASRGNDTSTPSDCVVIKLPIRTSTRWVMEVDIFGATSISTFSGAVTLLIAGYSTNNSQRVVSVIGGDSDRVKSVSFCRDEQNNSVIIVRFESDSTNFSYGKVNINKFYHGVTYNSDLDVKSNFSVSFEQEGSLTGLTTNGTITNAQFTRDSYLDFRQYGLGRYVTTLSGNSIDNGFTETGFYFVGGLDTNIVGTTNGKLINLGNPGYSAVQGQILLPHGGSNELAFRSTQNNNFSRVWHSGNLLQSSIDNWNTAFSWGNFRDYGLATPVPMSSGQDLSSLDFTGFAKTLGAGADYPDGIAGNGFVINNYISSARGHQIVSSVGSDRVFFRRNFNGFTPWVEFYHTGNLTNVGQLNNDAGYLTSVDLSGYLPLTGGTMSGDISIVKNGQAGANTRFLTLRDTDYSTNQGRVDIAMLATNTNTGTSRGAVISMRRTNNVGALHFEVADNNLLSLIGHSQNVGISTETPTEKLDVNGNIRVRALTSSGFVKTNAEGVLSVDTNDYALVGSLGNYVPYTDANQPINLNTQKITHDGIVSNVNSITSPWFRQTTPLTSSNKVMYLIIDGFIASTNRQLYIEVESVAGNGEYKRLVKGFNVNFASTNNLGTQSDSRYLEVTGTGSDIKYGIGEVEKHSDTALKIPLIWISSTALSISKVSVKAHTGNVSNLTFSIEYDATSTLTTENPYLYRNASEKWVKDNYDFRQYGLGTEAVVKSDLFENINETGFYAFATNQQGFNFPRAMLMKRGSQNYGLIFQNSGNKVGFLTGDGSTYTAWHSGNFNPSDYALVSQLPTVNDGQLSLTTGTGLSGSANFTANQSGNSSFSVGIASTHKLPTVAEWNALPTTDTTYTAGTGLTLSGTTFGQTITTSGTGTFVQSITQTTNGFQVNLGTPPNTTYSAGTLALLQAGTNTSNRVWSPKILADGVIRKGVNNVNPEGQPFSIEANNGRLILGEWGNFRFEEFGDQDCFFEFRPDEGPGLVVGHNHIDYEGTLAIGHLRFYGNGVVNTLSHNLNGYSRTRLPATGSAVERVLAVGATMGGSTYYANDNGLIDLPSSDGILSYSSANGIIVTDWNSFALSEYAMSLGYGSVTSGNYATSVGGLLSTTGFGSTNQGYSNSITKALGYAVGAYNSVRATLSGVFGIGLINRNDGAFVVGRYNSELPIEPYDTTSPHTQAVFAIGAGRDDTDRYTALTVFGDGRADYTEGYDDSNWTNNTLVTKKWVLDNAGGSSGGGVGYRNVDSSATFDLSSEYSGSVAENVYHIMTSSNVTFIGGNAVYDEGYKITIMTYSVGAYVVLDSSQGVKFIGSSGSQISYLDKPNRSVTFIYDKDYESFRVYHVSELLP